LAITISLFDWDLKESPEGFLDYNIVWQAITDDWTDGPPTIRAAAGIPVVGTAFVFGATSTTYVYARRPHAVHRMSKAPSDKRRWFVEQVFSNRPLTRYDVAGPIDDPLLEPYAIKGSAVHFLRRFTQNRDGTPLLMSNGERINGPECDEDDPRMLVEIEANVATVDVELFKDTLRYDPWNNDILWDCPIETVKFSDFGMQKMYKGDGTPYVRKSLKFELGGDFVREVLDEGWMEYIGPATETDAEVANPKNYARAKDTRGENVARLPLNGRGKILTNVNVPRFRQITLKGSSNLYNLGLPVSLFT